MSTKMGLLFFYACFLILLSLFKTAELFLPNIYAFEAFLGGDKLMHLTLAAVLTVLALLAFNSVRAGVRSIVARSTLVTILVMLGLLLDELHQTLLTTRRFEWLDFVYGLGGIGIALLLYLLSLMVFRFILLKAELKTGKIKK